MLHDYINVIHSIDPNVELGYNGAGNYDDLCETPQDVRDVVTYNSSEAKPHRLISFVAKIFAAWSNCFRC